jgi:MYXO-CTERM domain-containing protein
MKTHCTFALAVVLASSSASAVPVIPDAAGFGIETPAGRGGEIHRVTNLNASGDGSLKACIDASGPRVCVFETSGVIQTNKNLVVKNPFLTIAGQTAPSPGIMVRGAGLIVTTHDVLVQHIRVRPGDDPDGPTGTNRDALSIANSVEAPYNVVIDHCSFAWSTDEMISTWYEVGDVTIRHVLAAEALDDSIHVDEGVTDGTTDLHGFGPLFGPSTGRLAFYGSLVAHNRGRQPMSITAELVWVNNVAYDRSQAFTTLHNREGIASLNSLVGNLYLEGLSIIDWAEGSSPIQLTNELTEPASRVHLADNVWSEQPGSTDPWAMVSNKSGQSLSVLKADTPPTWVDGLVAKPTANDEALDWVLASAGARPADRDSVELRIVKDVQDGTGENINCVEDDGSERCAKNAGGWPVYEVNTQVFDAPDDPNGDEDDDGYTNLEEKLHELANAVEGNAGSSGTGSGGGSGSNTGGTSSGGGGSGGVAPSGGTSNGGGGSLSATPSASDDSGGCAVSATDRTGYAAMLFGLAALLGLARLRRGNSPRIG